MVVTPTLEQMATWPAPNYVNPHTIVPAIKGTMIAFTIFMVPFVVTRVRMRLRSKGSLGVDDYLVVCAALLSIASIIPPIICTKWGLGYQIWDVKLEWAPPFRKMIIPGATLFSVNIVLPKISVCFTYLLLFPQPRNVAFCWIMIVFLSCHAISTALVTIFQCRPIESYWLIDVPSEYCINATIFNIVTGVINTISDFLVYLWPIQFLWIIQIPVKQKLGVIFLFVIGVGACIAGVVRIYYVHQSLTSYQIFYYGACLWISSSVEVNIGIIFTCMHAMRPVLAKLVPEFFTSGSGGSSNKYSNEKSASNKSAASNKPKPRLNPFAAVSGVGKWITRMDDTKATTSSDNGDSTDSVELSPGLEGGYGAGTGKAKTRVTTGSVPADAPSDSIVYAQEVEVFAGRKA